MVYINTKYRSFPTETVDEFETMKEARDMLADCQMAYKDHDVWISERATLYWSQKNDEAK